MAKEFYVCPNCGEIFHFDSEDITEYLETVYIPDIGEMCDVVCPWCGMFSCRISEEEYNERKKQLRR